MNLSLRKTTVFALVVFSLLTSTLYAEDKPNLEEIAKTSAAKFFVEKKYGSSLLEFEKLEAQYPKSVIIKRYLASLHNTLHDWPKAVLKLQEALQIDSSDLIARQMLGDIYVKQADFKKAKEQFELIHSQDPEGRFGEYADKRLQTMTQMIGNSVSEKGRRMSTQDFMKSQAAQTFAKGEFTKALQGLDELSREYPEDPLVQRFRGITYMRLKKNKEALEALKVGVQKFPDNVAMRYYLAEAYVLTQNMEEARKEFRWVIDHDEAGYRVKAQQGMFMTLGGKQQAQKPWNLGLSNSYEYDTNATYKPSDENYRSVGDQNSGRYATLVTGSYQVYHKGRWFFTPDFFYAQNIYNDFINLNTYTPGGGVSALYGFSMMGKPTFLNIREGGSATYLKRTLYVLSNSFSASLISNLSKWLRVNLTYRWGYNNFNQNGTLPIYTDRDGHTHAVSLSNTIYLNQPKTFYTTLGYDFDYAPTVGQNYFKHGHGARIQLHFPMVEKVEGDVNFVFKDTDYTKYQGLPPERRDSVYTLTSTISRPLNTWLTLNFIYTFESSKARNNAYEYFKQVFAVKLAAQY